MKTSLSIHLMQMCKYGLVYLCYFLSYGVLIAQSPWSDPATWGGSVPTTGQDVTIPMGTHVLLDVNTPALGELTIMGTLEFDNQDLELTAENIMLMGTLQVGSSGAPYMNNALITLNDTDMALSATRGIMVMGGNLELHGNPTTVPFTKINAHALVGSTSLSLLQAVDWQVGDEVIVSPTDYYEAGFGASVTQKVNLTTVAATNVDIDAGLNAHRWGVLQYATNTGMSLTNSNIVTPPATSGFTPTVLDERAYVANLSRNIVIQAPNDVVWTNDGFGVHIMIMRDGGGTGTMGVAHVEGVEIRRGGQRGNLGRYPFHWHMISYNGTSEIGDATGQYFRNSSVNSSMNRGIVIHGTNGATVQNNVVYDIRGHGIFTEDASERRNLIDGNIVLHVRNPDAAYGLKNHEIGVNASRGSSGFWVSNPDNTVTNNVAGDNGTNGFWLAFPANTWGLSSGINIIPNRLEFGVFSDNVAFSNAFEGVLLDWVETSAAGDVFPASYISTTDGQNPAWPYPTVLRFRTERCAVWKNAFHGFWDRSALPDTHEFISADNCGRYFAGTGANGDLTRSLVIGTSLNHLMNGTDRPNLHGEVTPAAFATYHSAFNIHHNIVVDFPPVANTMSGMFATNDYYLRPVEIGHIRNPGNLMINSHPGVRLLSANPYFALAGAIWDPYSTWGGTAGDYLVYDRPFFTAGKSTTPVPPNTPTSGGVLVEGPFYGFNSFIVNDNNIRHEDYMAISVDRMDECFNVVDTWVVDEADPSWAFAHMRHFATTPDAYYHLEFPTITPVHDIGVSVTCMESSDDFQVISMEYSGAYTVDQIYISNTYNYFQQIASPASANKHIYQAVGCLEDVLYSTNGEVYWQDPANNRVWMKVRGGMDQTWTAGTYAADSDEELYWQFYLRVTGSAGAPTPSTTCTNNVVLDVNAFLQGPFNGTNMNTDLQTQALLPLAQPFNVAPFYYKGTEAVTSTPSNIVDWVLLEIRDAVDNTRILTRRAAFLRNDGKIVELDGSLGVDFPGIDANSGYVAVRHRNHLGIMTGTAVAF